MECLRLRVQNIDLAANQITVRDGKGFKDRVTMLPEVVTDPLLKHLKKVKRIRESDLAEGYGRVFMPYALDGLKSSSGKVSYTDLHKTPG